MKRVYFLFLLLLVSNILIAAAPKKQNNKNNPVKNWEKIKKWIDMSHTFQIGCYGSFDDMNSYIMDLHYGINFRFIKIARKYYLWDTSFEANMLMVFDFVNELPKIFPGFGINYYLRLHLFPIYKMTFFIEGGWGLMGYTQQYPVNGTWLNGARQVGGGIKWNLNQWDALVITVRWYHTSNNDIFGRERNPAVDSIGVTMGFDLGFLDRQQGEWK
ncbi:MAG: acyloxyacyl hydrolase [Spirochaetes bacterium]|nr:acyloxyacyl hydrolase [Spirochaetota bacterium]